MRSTFIIFAFLAFLVLVVRLDLRRRPGVSGAVWLVVLWTVVIGSRPVSTWFGYDASAGGIDAYVEGNPVERAVFLLMIVVGAVLLSRRNLDFGSIARANAWLCVFYVYWAVSIVWADDSFIAFKRCFKDFGNVIMALVVLTERNPLEAIRAVFVRCGYLLIPLSVLFIRYWTDLGRTFTGYNASDQMFIGVATHKNSLGILLLVCTIFLVWDFLSYRKENAGKKSADNYLVLGSLCFLLASTAWMLKIANSATSLLCAVIATCIIGAARLPVIRKRLQSLQTYIVVTAVLYWLADSMFNLSDWVVVAVLGRDLSMTGRSDAWQLVLEYVDNPLLGAGFKSFWSGERMARIWSSFYGVVQAHNGYLETYLNGGIIALVLLGAWLLSTARRINAALLGNPDFGVVRLAVFVVTLFYNYSEAAFNQLSLLWFVLLLVAIELPRPRRLWGAPVGHLATARDEHEFARTSRGWA